MFCEVPLFNFHYTTLLASSSAHNLPSQLSLFKVSSFPSVVPIAFDSHGLCEYPHFVCNHSSTTFMSHLAVIFQSQVWAVHFCYWSVPAPHIPWWSWVPFPHVLFSDRQFPILFITLTHRFLLCLLALNLNLHLVWLFMSVCRRLLFSNLCTPTLAPGVGPRFWMEQASSSSSSFAPCTFKTMSKAEYFL
jgi:hypothetical protein